MLTAFQNLNIMNSMREIDLNTFSLSLLTAKEDILNPRTSTNWALFAYDGILNRLKLADSGVGGLEELKSKFYPRRTLYGLCSVGKSQPCIVMILWVGKDVDEYRKAECASHLPAIRAFFKEVNIFLPTHNVDEITEGRICTLACKAAMMMQEPRGRHGLRREDREEAVGTNYRRTIATAEILRIQRDSFWVQAEREEEERKNEEQRMAAEDRRERERERLHQEKREAMERERTINEKDQKIQEQRKIKAQMKTEAHRQEKIKWEHQQRQREEEEMKARFSRSNSEEKSAEEAAVVSQRVTNHREFFRQLSSSSGVQSGSHPGSPYPAARSLYRRLERSQADNILIFYESSSSTPTLPCRSTVASPYFPSTPKSQSPTLVYPSPTMDSPSLSEQNFPTDRSMVSSKSQIHPSSLKLMESSYVSTPQLQTLPTSLTNATASGIKTPMTAMLDSFVLYPPPPNIDLLKLDNQCTDEPVEFSSPPFAIENSPEPFIDLPEVQTSIQTQPDIILTPQAIFDPSVFSSDLLTSSLPQSYPSLDAFVLVPQPPSRPLPALPVAPRLLKDLEPGREYTARASVISMVEEDVEEESEEKDGERNEERRINEIIEEGKEDIEEKLGVRGCQEKGKGSGKDKVEVIESGDYRNGGQEEQDRKITEKQESNKQPDGKILEECKSEKPQDGTIMEERESEKEQDGRIIAVHDSKDLQDINIMEENRSEEEQAWKIMGEHDTEKDEDGKSMEGFENEKTQDGNSMEECKSYAEKDGKILEQHEGEKLQDGKIMETFESEKIHHGKRMEELENENEKGSQKDSKERGNNQDENGQTLMNQESEEKPKVDVDRTRNLIMLNKEPQREIIVRNEAVDEENIEEIKSDKRNTSLIKTEDNVEAIILEEHPSIADKAIDESFAETLFSQHASPVRESHSNEPSQYSQTSLPKRISTNRDENELQDKSNFSNLSIQSDSQPDDIREEEFEHDSNLTNNFSTVMSCSCPSSKPCENSATLTQPTTEQGFNSEVITHMKVTMEDMKKKEEYEKRDGKFCKKEAKIVDGEFVLAEGFNPEQTASPISENQATTGQSDEKEGLATVRYFLKYPDECITHQSELDLTNEMSDFEEGEEAISLIASDTYAFEVGQSSKCDSALELNQVNEAIKHEFLQGGKTITEMPNDIRNDKKVDKSLKSGIGN
ncbi:uncharacterized protein LOC127624799 isoform X4 [Xyrauchen texanus]|uniref:uncharacterized protein LOC127624799 isoform X4 n=1 Tax=Xyrauchen texanus TaxID=154827 RepID=UPI0022424DDB|nr:uncharacterized protein LOC127624799 isoform X4 [Xyrauchen texanus]